MRVSQTTGGVCSFSKSTRQLQDEIRHVSIAKANETWPITSFHFCVSLKITGIVINIKKIGYYNLAKG